MPYPPANFQISSSFLPSRSRLQSPALPIYALLPRFKLPGLPFLSVLTGMFPRLLLTCFGLLCSSSSVVFERSPIFKAVALMQTKSGCRSHPCPSHEVFHAPNVSPWHLGAASGSGQDLSHSACCPQRSSAPFSSSSLAVVCSLL